MSKVITFSRTFPAYHPEAGNPTNFVQKILNVLTNTQGEDYFQKLLLLNTVNVANGKLSYNDLYNFWVREESAIENKFHTIRSGNRFTKGELFSPRIWSGVPYKSPQIIFWGDINVTNVYDFEIKKDGGSANDFLLDGISISFDNRYTGDFFYKNAVNAIAKNDGLGTDDFLAWFKYPQPFKGQIICWSNKVNY